MTEKEKQPVEQPAGPIDYNRLFSDEEHEYLKTLRVFIGTPAYGGNVSSFYTQGIATLFKIAGAYGLNFGLETIANESLITRARNNIVQDFIESDFSHLIFIDADIDFQPVDVFKLLLRKKDVISGAYPVKGINWDATVGAKTPQAAREAATHYVINLTPKQLEEHKGKKDIKISLTDGLLEVYDTGTGFLCISRDAIDKMIEAYGEDISYDSDSVSYDENGNALPGKKKVHALFDTSIDLETNRYLSEDYTFCRRWQKMGEQIWVDPSIILNHVGMNVYRGHIFVK
jgi:hypothetical protein